MITRKATNIFVKLQREVRNIIELLHSLILPFFVPISGLFLKIISASIESEQRVHSTHRQLFFRFYDCRSFLRHVVLLSYLMLHFSFFEKLRFEKLQSCCIPGAKGIQFGGLIGRGELGVAGPTTQISMLCQTN